MEVKIVKTGTGTAEITVNGNKKLAVKTNLTSKIYKQISMQDLLSEPAILINNGNSEKWECTESIEHEGKLIFPGPFYNGKTLAETSLQIDILLNLAISFQEIIKSNLPLTEFYTPGIFITKDNSVLFFPPNLINYITSQLSENESINYLQPYNHPNAKGETNFSFILGVLAYNLLTENLPFSGSTITEIREKMRSSKPVEIQLLIPGIKDSIANLINQSLILKNSKIDIWIKQLLLWKENTAVVNISNTKKSQLQKSAVKKLDNRKKQFKRNQFFAHNWKAMATIVAVFIVLISFSIGPIQNAMEPPITEGMTAKEVVETYYTGIIDMDVELMEDCIEKNAGKKDINEVTQLFVISRVRTGYEGKSGLISAQDWNDGIINNLEPGEQVYGIADLKLTIINESTYQAEYIRWYPDIPDDADSDEILPPRKIYIYDILTLEKVKDVWVIVNLERKKRTGRQ
ncbi:MAG: hypothetical protein PF693_12170 [Spirochaetia bacterium]|jgi:hypothetical protein|nr:hypothetical protein [Spirochaetia bacterium]